VPLAVIYVSAVLKQVVKVSNVFARGRHTLFTLLVTTCRALPLVGGLQHVL